MFRHETWLTGLRFNFGYVWTPRSFHEQFWLPSRRRCAHKGTSSGSWPGSSVVACPGSAWSSPQQRRSSVNILCVLVGCGSFHPFPIPHRLPIPSPFISTRYLRGDSFDAVLLEYFSLQYIAW